MDKTQFSNASDNLNITEDNVDYYWHIIIISAFMTVSVIVNGSTAYLERKYVKAQHYKVSVIALAIDDIFTCVLVLPFVPLFNREARRKKMKYG